MHLRSHRIFADPSDFHPIGKDLQTEYHFLLRNNTSTRDLLPSHTPEGVIQTAISDLYRLALDVLAQASDSVGARLRIDQIVLEHARDLPTFVQSIISLSEQIEHRQPSDVQNPVERGIAHHDNRVFETTGVNPDILGKLRSHASELISEARRSGLKYNFYTLLYQAAKSVAAEYAHRDLLNGKGPVALSMNATTPTFDNRRGRNRTRSRSRSSSRDGSQSRIRSHAAPLSVPFGPDWQSKSRDPLTRAAENLGRDVALGLHKPHYSGMVPMNDVVNACASALHTADDHLREQSRQKLAREYEQNVRDEHQREYIATHAARVAKQTTDYELADLRDQLADIRVSASNLEPFTDPSDDPNDIVQVSSAYKQRIERQRQADWNPNDRPNDRRYSNDRDRDPRNPRNNPGQHRSNSPGRYQSTPRGPPTQAGHSIPNDIPDRCPCCGQDHLACENIGPRVPDSNGVPQCFLQSPLMGRMNTHLTTLDDLKMLTLNASQYETVIRQARQYGCLRGSSDNDISDYNRRLQQHRELLLQSRPLSQPTGTTPFVIQLGSSGHA